ncbi:MAG: chromosomal replication initiator protein DnaA [Thermodesulfobacteriota bacterium]
MEAIWESVKDSLKAQIPPSSFNLWVEPLKPESGPEGEMLLVCPNPFARRWVQCHYLPLINQALRTLSHHNLPVHLQVPDHKPRRLAPPAVNQPALPLPSQRRGNGRSLNRAFTFDRFVVGPSNRLAFHASQALALNDTFYNGILFLAASPGLGKSHLSQAVGNFLQRSSPPPKILYMTAEDFANEMVGALKSGQMERFKERFRGECEVLLLEEVQFLSGKEKIQSELCYTLDTLLGLKKKLVFTSCYLPGEISHLSQKLRSRLTGGIIAPIGPPDFSTRLNILARKAEDRGVSASPKVLEYLAEHISGDVRLLESSLDCLVARSTLLKEPVSLRLAQEVLQDLHAVDSRLSIGRIQKIVGDYYQVGLREMLGRGRQKKLVRARQIAIYFARVYTQKTMVELGRLFQRSHAAVVHALQTLERDRQTQPRLAQEMKFLEEKMAQAQVKKEGRTGPNLHSDA